MLSQLGNKKRRLAIKVPSHPPNMQLCLFLSLYMPTSISKLKDEKIYKIMNAIES